MPRRPKAYVLDSWAIIAFLQAQPDGATIFDLLTSAHEHDIPLLMSVVNASEVWYIKARRTSSSDADKVIAELKQIGIEFVDVHWELAHEAARLKAKNQMSFADSFAVALARERKASLVTGDPAFKDIESEVSIEWLK